MGCPRKKEPLGRDGKRHRVGKRGRCLRSSARLPPGRCPHHDLHRFPGTSSDDPQHVQDRRRDAPGCLPRLGPRARVPCPLHLRRPSGRDGMPPDRLRPPRLRVSPGGPGPRRRGSPVRHQVQHSFPPFLRRIPHIARDPEDRGSGRGGTQEDGQREVPQGFPRESAQS